jgi:hypothetical protein
LLPFWPVQGKKFIFGGPNDFLLGLLVKPFSYNFVLLLFDVSQSFFFLPKKGGRDQKSPSTFYWVRPKKGYGTSINSKKNLALFCHFDHLQKHQNAFN